MTDFFISRAGEDCEMAVRIDAILRAAGYTTFIQDKDFGVADFTAKMDEGFGLVEGGSRLIALLSAAYLAKPHCMKEARYPLSDDPENMRQRLIPFKIDDCEPTGFLKSIRYIDLTGVLDDGAKLVAKILSSVDCEKYTDGDGALAPSERLSKLILLLETKDEELSESTFDKMTMVVLAVATLLTSFDYGLDFWNQLFATHYEAIFETSFVLFSLAVFLGLMFYAMHSQTSEIAQSIEKSNLSVAELRKLRELVKQRNWQSKSVMTSAVSKAIKNIADKK